MEMLNKAFEDAADYKDFEKHLVNPNWLAHRQMRMESRDEVSATTTVQVEIDSSLIRHDNESRAEYRERTRRVRAEWKRGATKPIKVAS